MSDTRSEDFSNGIAWMRGQLVPIGQAAIPVTDWGLTRSDITYDVVHVWDGAFFRLDDYLTRFEASVVALRLNIDQGKDNIKRILHDMLATSG
ncbi:MAG: branched-chain amino acid--2-keto-4-methylthiobutyrate aminotransferase, partial [Pseudomonadota bacterium]